MADVQEDKSRVEVFGEYARRSKESVYGPFLNMLNRPDTFTVNQVSAANSLSLSLSLCLSDNDSSVYSRTSSEHVWVDIQ